MIVSDDEYDAYYTPLDLEDILLFETAVDPDSPSASQPISETEPESQQTLQHEEDGDEFDEYDLSEFTVEDFARIDAVLAGLRPPSPLTSSRGKPTTDNERRGSGGGPRVEIRLEGPTDSYAFPKASVPISPLPPRPHHAPSRPHDALSPFQQFRNWNMFSVTDLVGPAWCEVQFDYGLRQKRSKAPEKRPDSFVTAEGKKISVDKKVAQKNDRRLTRGKKVHKVLEKEIRPVEIRVEATTKEERWGIRLINMLACLEALAEMGFCREMPVFGIVHDEVVVGVMDEVHREPALLNEMELKSPSHSATPTERSPNKRESTSTPSKKRTKKSRRTPSPTQPTLTSYFHVSERVSETGATGLSDSELWSTPKHRSDDDINVCTFIPAATIYTLHLSDTKTRHTRTLPPDEDTLSSRLQLMLYHRLLSSLLMPPTVVSPTLDAKNDPSAARPLDFDALWRRTRVDPSLPFSARFLCDSGLLENSHVILGGFSTGASGDSSSSGVTWCLSRLVAAWRHAVEALAVVGVDKNLTLVYRKQPKKNWAGYKEHEGAETASSLGLGVPLLSQEAADVARAIQMSLNQAPYLYDGEDDALAAAIAESVKEANESNGNDAQEDASTNDGLEQHNSDTLEESVDSRASQLVSKSQGQPTESLSSWQHMGAEDRLPEPGIRAGSIDSSPSIGGTEEHTPLITRVVEADAAPLPSGTEEEPIALADVAEEDMVPSVPTPSSGFDSSDSEQENMSRTIAELKTRARILGSKVFELNDSMLDEYLDSILEWWHGRRRPRGVDIALTRRCQGCEYREGCEWRETKALEARGTSVPSSTKA